MTTSIPSPLRTKSAGTTVPLPKEAFQRALNPMDCTMLAVDQALRHQGGAGFETMAMLRLDGRIDASRLRTAIATLCGRHPTLASRLTRVRGRFQWQSSLDAACPLDESWLPTADDDAVSSHAASRLSTPRDLGSDHPISFELLHRPDGQDVFLMQYNHAFIDNIAASSLLRHIDDSYQSVSESGDTIPRPHPLVQPDSLNDYLARIPRKQKLRAAAETVRLRLGKLRGTSIQVGGRCSHPTSTVNCITRRLDGAFTARLKRRALEKYRFPSVSMVLLASLFRSIRDVSPFGGDRDKYIVGIGLDLGIRRPETLALQNLVSLVPLDAKQSELADRDQLVQTLMQQLRRRIADRIDMGVIALSSIVQTFQSFTNWSMRRLMRSGYSCWYGCFDLPTPAGDQFCDTAVTELRYFGPAWTPPGFTLVVNNWHDQLLFQATYVPDTVPTDIAESLLDRFFADLQKLIDE